jgi:hypothetical protein
MKSRTIILICIFVLSYSSVAGQTVKDIEAKYGQRENVYSVSEHLWMTPAYSADNQLCMIRLYPKLVSRDTNYLDAKLDLDEVLKFIDQVVPIDTRGSRKVGFGLSDLGGGVVWTHFSYDQVRFVFISTFRLDKFTEQKTKEANVGLDFPIDDAAMAEFRREHARETDDALMRKHASSPKVLEVYWANRKCVKP